MTKNNMKSDTKNPSKKEGLLVHVVVPAKADKDIISLDVSTHNSIILQNE